jgi:hypothetical protein
MLWLGTKSALTSESPSSNTHNFHDFGLSKKNVLLGPNIKVNSGIAASSHVSTIEEELGAAVQT